MPYYTEVARHPDGYVLLARDDGNLTWMKLKLMRPVGPKRRDRRIWLRWNVDELRLGSSFGEEQFMHELPEIHDWVVDVLSRGAQ
jgi:hypothetical protein